METKAFALLPDVVDLLLDVVCVVDVAGRFVFVNAACERVFGYTREEMIGKSMIEMVAPEDRARTLEAAERIMAGHHQFHFENRYVRKDGRLVHIMWSARWSGEDKLRIAVARDITERKHAEALQAALYSISEASNAADDLFDLLRRIHHIIGELLPARHFAVALLEPGRDYPSLSYQVDAQGTSAAQLPPAMALLYAELVRTQQPLLLNRTTAGAWPAGVHALDHIDTCWLAVPLHSRKGMVGALFLKGGQGGAQYTEKDKELLRFVSTQIATALERKQLHARLEYTAQYDELTSLPNRRLFFDRLQAALKKARSQGGRMALLYIDLDKFKQVNDTYGHTAGDLLLCEASRRLKQCVRDSDTVARIGGDEFVILLESASLPEHAAVTASRIQAAMSEPFTMEGQGLSVLSSIGIALYPEHGSDAQQLLKHADEAMYAAKKNAGAALKAS